jgi:toxin ParE1/3/4
MSLPVVFRKAARYEFDEGAAKYEGQRPGLGVAFTLEIDRCVGLAAEQPEIYALVHKDIRHVTARHFPYSVYFRVEPSRIVVLSVFHGSRNPAIWRGRT